MSQFDQLPGRAAKEGGRSKARAAATGRLAERKICSITLPNHCNDKRFDPKKTGHNYMDNIWTYHIVARWLLDVGFQYGSKSRSNQSKSVLGTGFF